MESLKLFNVFGTATISPGRVIVLAISVRANRRSIERTVKRDILPIEGLDRTCQILFGAHIQAGRKPEIAVFQIQPGSDTERPDLFSIPEIRSAINDVVQLLEEALNKPHQPPRAEKALLH